MYFHAGMNKNIKIKEIIGIFDLDTSTVSAVTRRYLNDKSAADIVRCVEDGIPKSFVLTEKKIYITQISTTALLRRINFIND